VPGRARLRVQAETRQRRPFPWLASHTLHRPAGPEPRAQQSRRARRTCTPARAPDTPPRPPHCYPAASEPVPAGDGPSSAKILLSGNWTRAAASSALRTLRSLRTPSWTPAEAPRVHGDCPARPCPRPSMPTLRHAERPAGRGSPTPHRRTRAPSRGVGSCCRITAIPGRHPNHDRAWDRSPTRRIARRSRHVSRADDADAAPAAIFIRRHLSARRWPDEAAAASWVEAGGSPRSTRRRRSRSRPSRRAAGSPRWCSRARGIRIGSCRRP